MPRLSLWRNEYSKDYYWIDRNCREFFLVSGVGVLIHKYLGSSSDPRDSSGPAQPVGPVDPLGIQDLLLLENRDRKYDKNIYELRGIYNQNDTDFDLSQFGLFLSNDNIFVSFHINDMVERMGRPLMNGDVMEFPNLKDPFALLNVNKALRRFYVVSDTSRSSEGFSPTWYPHVWRAKVVPLVDSQEYKDILGDGSNPNDLLNYLSNYNTILDINNAVVDQAAADVPLSGYDTSMFWVTPTKPGNEVNTDDALELLTESGEPILTDNTGFAPPRGPGYTQGYLADFDGNGNATGFGISFPQSPTLNDYFKRTDFLPARLFRWDGYKWVYVDDAPRADLSPQGNNTLKGGFVNNDAKTLTPDGEVDQRQNLNDLLRPKAD